MIVIGSSVTDLSRVPTSGNILYTQYLLHKQPCSNRKSILLIYSSVNFLEFISEELCLSETTLHKPTTRLEQINFCSLSFALNVSLQLYEITRVSPYHCLLQMKICCYILHAMQLQIIPVVLLPFIRFALLVSI